MRILIAENEINLKLELLEFLSSFKKYFLKCLKVLRLLLRSHVSKIFFQKAEPMFDKLN